LTSLPAQASFTVDAGRPPPGRVTPNVAVMLCKENAMSDFTIVFLIASAFVLISGIVMAVRPFLQSRVEVLAPVHDYAGREYDRDLVQQSSWCDDENLYVLRTRYSLNVRDRGAHPLISRDSSTIRINRNRD
jgi:hypothetical protein